MTTEDSNNISPEDIADSWKLSPHMAQAIEHLWDATNTSYIATQIKSIEMAIDAIKKGRDRLKDKSKQHEATTSIKFMKNEISRLRKKLQRGVAMESGAERTKKKVPAHEKEIKRVHKATKKLHKELDKPSAPSNAVQLTEAGKKHLRDTNKKLQDTMAAAAPALQKAGAQLAQTVAGGVKNVGKKLAEAKKPAAKKKGKK